MKTFKPIYIERSNRNEKIAGVVFLLIIALVMGVAGALSAQTVNSDIRNASIQKSSDEATITWNASADSKYDFFLIERSQDNQNFEIVSVVKNTGNSNATTMFSATDHNPLQGGVYYRISKMDAKGKTIHLYEVKFNGNVEQISQR